MKTLGENLSLPRHQTIVQPFLLRPMSKLAKASLLFGSSVQCGALD